MSFVLTTIALWSLHGVRFARPSLTVGEDANVVSIHHRGTERANGVEDIGLSHLRREDPFELKLLGLKLIPWVLDQHVVVLALLMPIIPRRLETGWIHLQIIAF